MLHLFVVISMLSSFNTEVNIKDDFKNRETGKYIPEIFVKDGDSLAYQILLPNNYYEASELPIILTIRKSPFSI